MEQTSSTPPLLNVPGAVSSTKPRYALLDGLRGVAALFVILYHFGEGFATSPVDQFMNHGYLAVDFFFILSGFVIGYAYDSRWQKGMTAGRFMLRRVIRLHPMVIIAVVLGAIAWIIQGSIRWDGTPMPLSNLLIAIVLGLLLIPTFPGAGSDVRGNNEMFPLNGPSWSLFFEYIGSLLYALWLHRLSTKWLRVYTLISAIGLIVSTMCNMSGAYHLGVGWSMIDYGFWGGFFRMSFAFSLGLLMSRDFKPIKIRGAFWICTIILAVIFSVPYVSGGDDISILNAFYDLASAMIFLPLVVYLGASGKTTDRTSTGICETLGQLSYPVYISHYPIMYLFYAWVWSNNITVQEAWPICVFIFISILAIAWLLLKFYDMPVRSYLTRLLRRHI